MASYSFIIDAMNDIVVDHDGEGGHVYWIDAVNEWCTALEGNGGHSSIIDGLNEVCTLLDGNGGHSYTIDAHNEISTLRGGTGGYRFDIDALNEIADLPLGGALVPGPTTSIIEWVDATSTSSTPNFNVELPFGNGAPLDVAVGDVLEVRANGVFWFATDPFTEEDLESNPIALSGITPLDDGEYDIDCRLTRTGAIPADWSAVATGAIDTVAPTITTSATANNPENNVLAISLTADEAVTWAIRTSAQDAASVDYDEFEISGTTLRWTSNGTRDFEEPDDDGTNNTYIVVIRATDLFGHTTDKTITVTVTDEDDQSLRDWVNSSGILLNQTAVNARQWVSASGVLNVES